MAQRQGRQSLPYTDCVRIVWQSSSARYRCSICGALSVAYLCPHDKGGPDNEHVYLCARHADDPVAVRGHVALLILSQ